MQSIEEVWTARARKMRRERWERIRADNGRVRCGDRHGALDVLGGSAPEQAHHVRFTPKATEVLHCREMT